MNGPADELARARQAYDAATAAWHRARKAGQLAEELDEYQARAGVRWRGTDGAGRAVLANWQLAKSNLDHAARLVRLHAGDESCAECKETHRRMEERNLPNAEQLDVLRREADGTLPYGND